MDFFLCINVEHPHRMFEDDDCGSSFSSQFSEHYDLRTGSAVLSGVGLLSTVCTWRSAFVFVSCR